MPEAQEKPKEKKEGYRVYVCIKPFELDGKMQKLGQEIPLGHREGENLVEKGMVKVSDRVLDLDDPADAALNAGVRDRKEQKHAEMNAANVAKDQARGEREAAKDVSIADARKAAKALLPQRDPRKKEIDAMSDVAEIQKMMPALEEEKKERDRK